MVHMRAEYKEAAMLREFCAENLINVREAIEAGAQRVEICGDLSVSGVTPSDEVMARAIALVHSLGATAMVMIRPRGGDFAYSEDELAAMEKSVGLARSLGADGVAFGCARGGELDECATRRLANAAYGLDCTFHMAFDEISPVRQREALSVLAGLGFSRVLTHGAPLAQPLEQCLPHLHELVDAAEPYGIGIMPGGGVTWQNVEAVCAELGVSEAHGTRIVQLEKD